MITFFILFVFHLGVVVINWTYQTSLAKLLLTIYETSAVVQSTVEPKYQAPYPLAFGSLPEVMLKSRHSVRSRCSLAKTAATGASLREVTTAAVKRCRAFFVNSLSLSLSLSLLFPPQLSS